VRPHRSASCSVSPQPLESVRASVVISLGHQRIRKRIEEPFGWGKTIGGLARPMLCGVQKLAFKFILTMAGYNLIRLRDAPRRSNDLHHRASQHGHRRNRG
jgi:hypothetical protein